MHEPKQVEIWNFDRELNLLFKALFWIIIFFSEGIRDIWLSTRCHISYFLENITENSQPCSLCHYKKFDVSCMCRPRKYSDCLVIGSECRIRTVLAAQLRYVMRHLISRAHSYCATVLVYMEILNEVCIYFFLCLFHIIISQSWIHSTCFLTQRFFI